MTISVKQEMPGAVMLRKADEAECLAAGICPYDAVKMSADASTERYFVYDNERLVAMWGFAAESLFSYRCRAWLLTTPAIEGLKVKFTRSSLRVMAYLFETYEEVEVYVHLRHEEALKWLTWLGFEQFARSDDFAFMLAKKESARWVS